MKIFVLVIGVIFTVIGLGMTGYSWYAASSEGHILDAMAYPGPFLIIVGGWRILASAMASAPRLMRIVAVVLGFGAGYLNAAALKTAFPNDQVIASSNTTTTNTTNSNN